MQRVGLPYVRWFNRSRKRDGPLFRGRFGGRRIDGGTYWLTVLRYIDMNAPRAGPCALPSEHLYGSASAYRTGDGPAWLARDAVERAVADADPRGVFRAADYDRFASSSDPGVAAHLVERMMDQPSLPTPRFADLGRAAAVRQQNWMQWKAALAEGTVPGTAFLSPDAAGLDRGEVARRVGVGRTSVFDAIRRHAARLASDPAYDELVRRALGTAVRRTLPAPSHAFDLPMRIARGTQEPLIVAAMS